MWTQSKDLHTLVENTINKQQIDSIVNLEKALKLHRSDFFALLKQPVMFCETSNNQINQFSPTLSSSRKMPTTEICC